MAEGMSKLDSYEVVVGFCSHGNAVAFCYDMPGLQRDVRDLYKRYPRVERMSASDSRARLTGLCETCVAKAEGKGV